MLVNERRDRQAHPDHGRDLPGPHPAGVDQNLRADRAVVGLDGRDLAPRGPRDAGDAYARVDLDAEPARLRGQLHRRPARIEPAIARQVHRAVEVVARHERKDAQRFRGRDRVDVEPDRPGHADLALEEPKLIAARRDAEAAHLVPVLGRARRGLQASIEPDAVLPHPHERRRGVEVRHHPRRMPRGPARQRPLVDEHDVRPALPRQMVGDTTSRDAATDDDDPRLPLHASAAPTAPSRA